MYAMTQTRLDLAFPVSLLLRFAINLSAAYIGAAKRVLKYLKHTQDLRITYNGHTEHGAFRGYLDADQAGDIKTQSLTSAYVFFLFSAPITQKSLRQHTIALLSTESKYYGLTNAAKEAIQLQTLLTELQYHGKEHVPTHIYRDN